LQQCNSGGFIDDLDAPNTVIMAASDYDEKSYEADDVDPDGADDVENEVYQDETYYHGEFNYHMINSVMLKTIIGNSLPAPDTNSDGLTSTTEAFNWAEYKNSGPETVQFLKRGGDSFLNIAPYQPQNFDGMWAGNHPKITWDANEEYDLQHYQILKKTGGGGYIDYDTTTEEEYVDNSEWKYSRGYLREYVYYKVEAVDDANQHSIPTDYERFAVRAIQSKELTDRLIPAKYTIGNNTPNPFNPISSIRYGLPEESIVVLKIYDLMGREIKTIVDGTEKAGFKSIMWDSKDKNGRPVPSGMYFYRLDAVSKDSEKELHETRKMVLLK